jgi:branched-chain amino acid transport system permease protein
MVILSLTWDLIGGQMGYNSFGNIIFFGIGAYAAAVAQRGGWAPGYFGGLALGTAIGVALSAATAVVLGSAILRLRGHYFAICTLGLGIAAGEIASGWGYVGAGSGMVPPVFPGDPDSRGIFFYYFFAVTALLCFLVLRWLYGTRFGLAINAIRDDEDKAEALGLHTARYKTVGWSIAAFFLGIAGALFGNMTGFIEPLETAYPTLTFGIFMVAMTLLGGKGTLWGPIIGATVFYTLREVTWTYLLGWQYVALGLLIIVNVVYFQQGILGWLKARRPEWFGVRAP